MISNFVERLVALFSIIFGIAVTISAPLTFAADAVSLSPIIDVTGKLDPKFVVKLDPQDVVKLVQELKGLNQLPSRTIDINDLMRDGDEDAIKAATRAVSDAFLDSAKDLLNLKAMAYKLAALFAISDTATSRDEIAQAYQKHFQTVYESLIRRLAEVNPSLLSAMELCKSELCVSKIFATQFDLVELGKVMNVGLNSNMSILPPDSPQKRQKQRSASSTPQVQGVMFQGQITQYALEQTHTTLQSQHDDSTGFALMLNTVLSPFVQAGRAVSQLMTDISQCLNTPQLKGYVLRAHPVPVDYTSNIQIARSVLKQVTQSIVSHRPISDFNPFVGIWQWNDQKKKFIVIPPHDRSQNFRIERSWSAWDDSGRTVPLRGKLAIFLDREFILGARVEHWLVIETTPDPNILNGTYPVYFNPDTKEITYPTGKTIDRKIRLTRKTR